jgi:hypothetical protein
VSDEEDETMKKLLCKTCGVRGVPTVFSTLNNGSIEVWNPLCSVCAPIFSRLLRESSNALRAAWPKMSAAEQKAHFEKLEARVRDERLVSPQYAADKARFEEIMGVRS